MSSFSSLISLSKSISSTLYFTSSISSPLLDSLGLTLYNFSSKPNKYLSKSKHSIERSPTLLIVIIGACVFVYTFFNEYIPLSLNITVIIDIIINTSNEMLSITKLFLPLLKLNIFLPKIKNNMKGINKRIILSTLSLTILTIALKNSPNTCPVPSLTL